MFRRFEEPIGVHCQGIYYDSRSTDNKKYLDKRYSHMKEAKMGIMTMSSAPTEHHFFDDFYKNKAHKYKF